MIPLYKLVTKAFEIPLQEARMARDKGLEELLLTASNNVVAPVNWNHGEDLPILPAGSDQAARQNYPRRWKPAWPYLRIVFQPK